MYAGWVIAFSLALSIGSASAQQTSNRIDLDVSEAAPLPNESASPPAISGIAFRPVDLVCPEEHGTIEIRSGQMYLSRINSRGPAGSSTPPGSAAAHFHAKPLDDRTYQYEIGNAECRVILQIRLQTQRDSGWQPALLPYWSRPSIPKEERSDLARETMKFMKSRREGENSESKSPLPQSPRVQMLGASAIGEGFFFEASPKAMLADCFQAVGSYDINGEGSCVGSLET